MIEIAASGVVPRYVDGVYKVYAAGAGEVLPGTGAKIAAGFRMKVPANYFGKIQRSVIKTLGGVVDSDYRGEVSVLVYNDTDRPFVYARGDEVAEMAVCRIVVGDIEV